MWLDGLLVALEPTNLGYLVLGNLIGLVVGVLPAVGPTFGVALALPFTIGLDPVTALVFLCAIHATCSYADSITSILMNTPGSAISVPSCWDGFPLTQQGKGGMALGMAAVGSFTGGLIGWWCLVVLARPMTRLAVEIGAPEYFALAVMAFSLVSLASSGSKVKGVLWACLGVGISFVGRDPIAGLTSRFSLGILWLEGGVPIIVSALGLFAMPQVVAMLGGGASLVEVEEARDSILGGAWEVFRRPLTVLRASAIGVFIGILPALGTSLASLTAYLAERRVSPERAWFGRGAPAGLVAAEVSKGACVVGDLIPTFTLGIPGSITAALLMGALTVHGIDAGPQFMTSGTMPYALFAGILLTQVCLLVTGVAIARYCARVVLVPTALLAPSIVALCFLGAYVDRGTLFDVGLTILFGFVGLLSESVGYPVVALLLGILLGPLVEVNFHRSLGIGLGSYAVFVSRPIAGSLLGLTAAVAIWALGSRLWKRTRRRGTLAADVEDPEAPRAGSRGAELGVLAVALSAFGLMLAGTRQLAGASGMFPQMVAVAGLALGTYRAAIVILGAPPAGDVRPAESPRPRPWAAPALAFGGFGAYALAWSLVGFPVATGLYTMAAGWVAGYRRPEILVPLALLWGGCLYLLAWLTEIPLQHGLLVELLG